MVKRIWKNRLEFYPACALFIWYAVGCVLTSLTVRDRPGIVSLGLITLPSVSLYIAAVIRTYRELPPAGRNV